MVRVSGHGSFRKRILELGFIKGNVVKVILNAPLKDPIEYEIIGYKISLRREEADMIEVISESEAKESLGKPATSATVIAESCDEAEILSQRMKDLAEQRRHVIRVALVGNPNCGKTSLFNIASGSHEHVGNYSGVTVDAKEGNFEYGGYKFVIVDLPGTYSISGFSPEELYVRKNLVEETPDIIINVVDSSNLERNLYLTTQIIDMNLRVIMALNMYDELKAKGDELDIRTLGQLLGMPLVPTVSKTGEGIHELFDKVIELYENPDPQIARHIHINHGNELEQSIDRVKLAIQKNADIRYKYSTRYLAIKFLENDRETAGIIDSLPNKDEIIAIRFEEQKRFEQLMGTSTESAIIDAKYAFVKGALAETYKPGKIQKKHRSVTDRIDAVVTDRWLAFPVFFLMLYIVFFGTFTLGEYPMQWIDWLVSGFGDFVSSVMPDGMVKDLVVDGIIGGVGSVLVFLPNIVLLYFFISLLEDSGYMARAAFIMDRLMHKMGLHGKSFIPMILSAKILSRFFKDDDLPFVMELPPYRVPTSKSILRHTWEKGKQYLHKITGIILISSVIIWFLGYFPHHNDYPDKVTQQENSYLGYIGKAIEPVLEPLGFDWQMGVGLLSGVAAKELVVSSMGVMYSIDEDVESGSGETKLQQALQNSITPAAALAFMVFVLLYFPCIATFGAMMTETGGWKWPLFSAVYTIVIAWVMAFIVYRAALLF